MNWKHFEESVYKCSDKCWKKHYITWNIFCLGYVWTSWSRENINNNNKFKFVQHKNWLKWALLNFKTLSAQRKTCVFAKSLFHNLSFRIQGATIVVDN